MNVGDELDAFVERRYRLAGGNILARHNPYNQELDRLLEVARASGGSLVSLANYDYLDIGKDERVRRAAVDATLEQGVGVGASRMVGGERSGHRAFEREIADFIGQPAALSLVSGYNTNVSLLGHLLGTADLVLVDSLSHNSIMVGAEVTRATVVQFKHNDLDHLQYLLARFRRNHKRALIVGEGLYSMDGDFPDLPRLLDLKDRHDAWLLLDEAHSVGVMGETGRGLAEHYGVDPQRVEFVVGTLSKAFAGCGGYIASRESVIHWLRHTLPGHVFSVGSPPPVIAAARQALQILRAEPERVAALRANSRFFLDGAKRLGLDVATATGHGIVPVLFKSRETAFAAYAALLQAGYFIPPIVQIGVPKDQPRLRVFLSSGTRRDVMTRVLDILARVATAAGELASPEGPTVVPFPAEPLVLKRAADRVRAVAGAGENG
jgi:7-keto-8-aminopelargonate synthetase-like enzyme